MVLPPWACVGKQQSACPFKLSYFRGGENKHNLMNFIVEST